MNKNYGKIRIALAGLAALGLSACYRDAHLQGPVEYDFDGSYDSMVEVIRAFAESRVVVLDREIHTYHYGWGPDEYVNPDAQTHTNNVNGSNADAFHNPNKTHPARPFNTWLGDGYYTAMDPSITREYASPNFLESWKADFNAPWNLSRVALPAGSRVLDIGVSNPLPEEIVYALRGFGCDITFEYKRNGRTGPSIYQFNTSPDLYDLFVVSEEGRNICRKLLVDVFAQLDVMAVMYPFSTQLRSTGNPAIRSVCTKPTSRAFIITGQLPAGAVRYFTRVLPPGGDSADYERIMIQAIYGRIGKFPALWPELLYQDPGDEAVAEYAAHYLYGCGNYESDPTTLDNH